ncbi:hypothetical protein Droror1_Dr00011799 [Drosera rotundifolia]
MGTEMESTSRLDSVFCIDGQGKKWGICALGGVEKRCLQVEWRRWFVSMEESSRALQVKFFCDLWREWGAGMGAVVPTHQVPNRVPHRLQKNYPASLPPKPRRRPISPSLAAASPKTPHSSHTCLPLVSHSSPVEPRHRLPHNTDLFSCRAPPPRLRGYPLTRRCRTLLLRCDGGLHQISYVRGESRFSDHRPVCSIFWSEVESVQGRLRKTMSRSSSRKTKLLLIQSATLSCCS